MRQQDQSEINLVHIYNHKCIHIWGKQGYRRMWNYSETKIFFNGAEYSPVTLCCNPWLQSKSTSFCLFSWLRVTQHSLVHRLQTHPRHQPQMIDDRLNHWYNKCHSLEFPQHSSPRVNEEGSWILDDNDANINSVLGLLNQVEVGNVTSISQTYALRVFRGEVCSMSMVLCTYMGRGGQ
jgi:hypothetical protein